MWQVPKVRMEATSATKYHAMIPSTYGKNSPYVHHTRLSTAAGAITRRRRDGIRRNYRLRSHTTGLL
jgi:hypothetical protein